MLQPSPLALLAAVENVEVERGDGSKMGTHGPWGEEISIQERIATMEMAT